MFMTIQQDTVLASEMQLTCKTVVIRVFWFSYCCSISVNTCDPKDF